MKKLYLGSTSASRQMLLREAKIPFTLVTQSADESKCDWSQPLEKVVQDIALYKMEQLLLPIGNDGDVCYVLTADTLTEDSNGVLQGKPIDRQDAIIKLKSARVGTRTGTAFCLDRRYYINGAWIVDERVIKFVDAYYKFIVPDHFIEHYLDTMNVGTCAIAIEGFGGQFLQSINGSYTAVVGLPMYELRESLTELNFFVV